MKVMNATELRRSRRARLALCLLPLAACAALIAAAPPQTETPDDLIRRANDAFRAGDKDAADALYALAEERTADPGLVAFNRGTVAFDRGAKALDLKQLRDAEEHYERVLKDAACPPERAAKAWYNRGTCLLWHGGSIEVYRAAAACFEHTLDSDAADEQLKVRARDNLERAKLLWTEERKKKENEKKTPNSDIPREEPDKPKPQPEKPGGNDTNPGDSTETKKGDTIPKPAGAQPQQQPNGTNPNQTDQTVPGNNASLQPLPDTVDVRPLSEKQARDNLAATAKRIKREQQSLLRTLYGPERANVRDW